MEVLIQVTKKAMFYGNPVVISTETMRVAEAIKNVASRPFAAQDDLAQEVIPGHGPAEVVVLKWGEYQEKFIDELLNLGYQYADPVTLCAYLEQYGWPREDNGSSQHIATFWKGHYLNGYKFSCGSRMDFDEEKQRPFFFVFMKMVEEVS